MGKYQNVTAYKIVHRVKSETYRPEYELIGTPSLIHIETGARSVDVAQVACVLCAKSCVEILLDTIRRDGNNVRNENNASNDDEDEDGEYEMVGNADEYVEDEEEEEEEERIRMLMQQPWLVLLNSGLCEIRIVQGSRRNILRVEEGIHIPLEEDSFASEYMLSAHSTICFDWLPHVADSLLDLNAPENCIMHPSFTMEREKGDGNGGYGYGGNSGNGGNGGNGGGNNQGHEMETKSAQGKETSVTLFHCLDRFTASESLSLQCERCNESAASLDEHSKKLSFTRLPPVLLVSFKRFKNIHAKIETLVSFPVRGLDMSKWYEQENENINSQNPMYDLVAVLNHSGKLGYGHYTAYGITEQGSWALYDDENVTIVSDGEEGEKIDGELFKSADDEVTAASLRLSDILVSRKAYLLVYVQRRGRHEEEKQERARRKNRRRRNRGGEQQQQNDR
jgi:hypothetical protein